MSASEATRNSISALSKWCQRINRVQVGRVGDGDGDFAVGFENGDDAVFFGDVAGNDGDDFVVEFSCPARWTTSAPNCAALACVTSAGRMTLLASIKSTTPTPAACGFVRGFGQLARR